MIFNKLISIAAALAVGGMTLYAAPDHMMRGDDQRKDRSDNQGRSFSQDRSGTPGRSGGTERSFNQSRSFSQERSYQQQQRTERRDKTPSKGEIRRQEVQRSQQKKYTPHPVKPLPSQRQPSRTEKRSTLPPPLQRQNIRTSPAAKYKTPPGTFRRIERPRHYYRPPGVKPLPYYHRPGYVIRTLPRLAVTLTVGGLLFYYADGIYYRHASSGFIVATPPLGLIVHNLPVGYTVFILGGRTYYYYADVYYVWDSYRGGYRVVQAPVDASTYAPGDIVDTLPDGAASVTINGVQYYRYGDIYFMQAIQGDRIVYVVVNP